jgi:hypothetical protein
MEAASPDVLVAYAGAPTAPTGTQRRFPVTRPCAAAT